MNSTSVLGKYIAKMKLQQFNGKGWDDAVALIRAHDRQLEAIEEQTKMMEEMQAGLQEKLEAGQISEAEYKTLIDTSVLNDQYQQSIMMGTNPAPMTAIGVGNNFDEGNFISEEQLGLGSDLTQDDKLYLALKWGRLYKPME